MPDRKPLNELNANKAGVSQAVLTKAYDTVDLLAEELAEEDAKVVEALAKKKKAQAEYEKVKEEMRKVNASRDAVQEEWQQAAWIVRNADPDYPLPPTGMVMPGIKTPRS